MENGYFPQVIGLLGNVAIGKIKLMTLCMDNKTSLLKRIQQLEKIFWEKRNLWAHAEQKLFNDVGCWEGVFGVKKILSKVPDKTA
jgi:hypothetical protein